MIVGLRAELEVPEHGERTRADKVVCFTALILCALFCVGCGSGTRDCQLRVKNQSDYVMEGVTISFWGTPTYWGTVLAGQTSEYRRMAKPVYLCAPVKLTVEGTSLQRKPMDRTGDPEYDQGQFTLVIDVDFSRGTEDALQVLRLDRDE